MAVDSGKIQTKLEISGEKEYSSAIQAANRNLKTLRSELKAETAELGRNASEQDKNRVKAENLKKQIAEQEKIVAQLKAALEKAKTEYADNEEVVAKWELKLNQARTSLANMKNSLDDVGSSQQNLSSSTNESVIATNSLSQSLSSISTIAGGMTDALENIFMSLVDTITSAVSDAWAIIVDTANQANTWSDTAAFWNTNASNIQLWQAAVEGAHNSFSTLESAVTRIVLGGKTDKITELLGVSDVNYEDQWSYAMAVMDAFKDLQGTDTSKFQDAMTAIFGEKKAVGVMDLLNDWETIVGLRKDFEDQGYGMSDDQITTMSGVAEDIDTVTQKWEMLKQKWAAGLGETTADLFVNINGTVDAINEYFNAEDDAGRQAALEKIKTNLEDFFTKLGDLIKESFKILDQVGTDLQQSDNSAVAAIGNAITSLVDAMEWLSNDGNWKKALEAFFAAWLTGKAVEAAGTIATMAANIAVIKGFNGIGKGGSTPVVTNPTGQNTGQVAEEAGKNAGWFAPAVTKAAAAVAPWAALLATEAGLTYILDKNFKESNYGWIDEAGGQQNVVDNMSGLMQELSAAWFNQATDMDWMENTKNILRQMDANALIAMFPNLFTDREKEDFGFTDGITPEEWSTFIDSQSRFATDWESFYNNLFSGATQGQMNGWDNINIPAWGEGTGTGGTGVKPEDIAGLKTMPDKVGSAVQRGISGIKVTMDGRTVGNLVAPYVSQYIAAQIN